MNRDSPFAAPIEPPAMLGVLGGGQLGRYFVIAARTMGYRVTVLEPDAQSPAGALADHHIVAAYDDPFALRTLADSCAVVTTEFENPPASALQFLAQHTIVRPSASAIGIAQDRIAEKAFLGGIGVNVGPYRVIRSADDLAGCADLPFPAVLKTARFGYDGKGQKRVASLDVLAEAWESLGSVPCVLEQRLVLDRELSMVVARTADDRTAAYPVAENRHVDGILDTTFVPAWLPGDGQEQAAELCFYIAREMDYVGVLGVEMFVVGNDVLVNELAPRPHNTGHYTLDACRTSQFEQQVRAVCGLGLGDTTMSAPAAAMANLLGELWEFGEPLWVRALAEPGAHLHLYGKAEPRHGRKMGHLTLTGEYGPTAETMVRKLRRLVKVHPEIPDLPEMPVEMPETPEPLDTPDAGDGA